MNTPFIGPDAERLADAIEAGASRDMYRAAPPELALHCLELAGATALIAPSLPVSYFNRVIGLGNQLPATAADIEAAQAHYRQHGVRLFWIHVSPLALTEPFSAALALHGFVPASRPRWAKFLRGPDAPPTASTSLTLRAATTADAPAVAAVVCAAYGMPATIAPWFATLVGRRDWHVWVAEDDGRIVATGAIFIDGETAWLGMGATLVEHRGRGAQSALLAARIQAAAALGCRVIATETGEPVGDEPNPSLANIRRAGFQQVCSRLNYASPHRFGNRYFPDQVYPAQALDARIASDSDHVTLHRGNRCTSRLSGWHGFTETGQTGIRHNAQRDALKPANDLPD